MHCVLLTITIKELLLKVVTPIFVNRKPRDSRVVEKRLTDEEKNLQIWYNKKDLPVKLKNIFGGFIYEKG